MTPTTPAQGPKGLTTLTLSDLTRLDELRKRATPGPYKCRKSVYGNKYRVVQFDQGPAETSMYTTSELEPGDARFLAALDPDTIGALIELARKGLQQQQ